MEEGKQLVNEEWGGRVFSLY